MVDKRTTISNLKPLVKKVQCSQMGKVDYVEPAVEFFISFDIVNSTMYKATHMDI